MKNKYSISKDVVLRYDSRSVAIVDHDGRFTRDYAKRASKITDLSMIQVGMRGAYLKPILHKAQRVCESVYAKIFPYRKGQLIVESRSFFMSNSDIKNRQECVVPKNENIYFYGKSLEQYLDAHSLFPLLLGQLENAPISGSDPYCINKNRGPCPSTLERKRLISETRLRSAENCAPEKPDCIMLGILFRDNWVGHAIDIQVQFERDKLGSATAIRTFSVYLSPPSPPPSAGTAMPDFEVKY